MSAAEKAEKVQVLYDEKVSQINGILDEMQELREKIQPLKTERDKLQDALLILRSKNSARMVDAANNASEVLASL